MRTRVLLVDDQVLILKIAKAFLEGTYEVITASSGDEALAKAAEVRPDVIVTDFNMPGRNGVETAQRLQQDARTRSIPVVIMTTESEAPRIPQGFDLLCKPFVAPTLLSVVAAQVRRPAARRAA